jgi:hypothetical protein
LDIVGAKHVDKFKKDLEYSVFKKILYRQNEFADHIQLQNKTHLDYFYLEDGKQKESPRKFKLDKINERMSPKKANDEDMHAPAFYTSFNFNKLFSSRRYSDTDPKHKAKKISNETSKESLMSIALNKDEERLVGFSHSWCPIEKKVKQEKTVSQRISPFRHQMYFLYLFSNIEAPLIDQKYFRDTAKEKQRINKEYRTFRLSLGKKVK